MKKVIIEQLEDLETKTRNLDIDKFDECCNFANFLNLLPSGIFLLIIGFKI